MKDQFRPYSSADKNACLKIFDANCPTFLAPNERADYMSFLEAVPNNYEVYEAEGCVVAAFGLESDEGEGATLNWILLHPNSQGTGLGSAIMHRVILQCRESQVSKIKIATSHKSAVFFTKFGAVAKGFTKDGWGPDMDRVDMVLYL